MEAIEAIRRLEWECEGLEEKVVNRGVERWEIWG